MEFTTVDSMYENLFYAQNFFSVQVQKQEQLEKHNSTMANCSLLDLDILRCEVGSGDASGSLLLGENFCSSFNDDVNTSSSRANGSIMEAAPAASTVGAPVDKKSAAGKAGTAASASTVAASTVAASTVAASTVAASTVAAATAASAYMQLGINDKDNTILNNDKDDNISNGNGITNGNTINGSTRNMFENRTSLYGGWLWPPYMCNSRPSPFIRIGEEKFELCHDTVFVLGMRLNVTKNDIIMFFGKMGHIKVDERTLKPKIFVYKNKLTGRSKGEATITYTSLYSAQAAIYYLDGAKFLGQTLSVVPAYLSTRPGKGVYYGYAQDPAIHSRQRQKKWKPAIDNWVCQLCRNSNFVWRLNCNRCRVSKSEAINPDMREDYGLRRHIYDWTCGYCFNINFWYRQQCNRCRAVKIEPKSTSDSEKDKWEFVLSQTSFK